LNTENENNNEIEINAENVSISEPTTDTLNTDNENNNQIEMNAENVSISDPSEIPSIKEWLNTIKSSSSPPISFDQHPTTKILQNKYNDFIYNQSIYHCHYCKERWYDFDGEYDNNIFKCKKCINDRKKNFNQIGTFSSKNDMDPKIDLMYHLLPELNNIEEMFIARVQPVMKVFRLEKGRIDYKGNVLNMEQDLQPDLDKLPLIPSQMPIFVCRKSNPNSPNRYKDFKVNRDKILKWLIWLKNNNKHYKDITINFDALSTLPADGSIFNDLCSYDVDDKAEDEAGLDDGPDQLNASSLLPGEENIHVSEGYACINPLFLTKPVV